MSHVVLIGTPDSWSETQVAMLAERLIADALPEACSVSYTWAELVDVPLSATVLLRAPGKDD